MFNTSPISPRRCRILLTKIALLLFTGERFPTNEATSLFFGISKLFQNKDASLRQMVYLVIKELANTAEDVIMVTSSIMKDTAVGSDVVYRANAIRALCRIIDVSNSCVSHPAGPSLLMYRRPLPCKPSSVTSKPQLSTKSLRSRQLLWSHHIIFFQLRAISSGDGRAKLRKPLPPPNHPEDSLSVSAGARTVWPPPTPIS